MFSRTAGHRGQGLLHSWENLLPGHLRKDEVMKTGKKCLVCTSEDKDAINAKLIAGLSVRAVGEEYNISKSAISYHRTKHLPRDLVKSKQLAEVDAANQLVERIESLYERALKLLNVAEKDRKFAPAVSAIREARASLELLARISGELKSGTHLTLIYSPQWVELRQVLVQALEPFPEARAVVVDALEVTEIEQTIEG
jgi:hypothetical protein